MSYYKNDSKKPIDNLISLDSFDQQKPDNSYNEVLNGIADLKRTIEATGVSSDKDVARDGNGVVGDANTSALLKISEEILRSIKQMNNKFTEEIADIRSIISSQEQKDLPLVQTASSADDSRTDGTSALVLRQLYSIKSMVSNSATLSARNNRQLLEIYDLLDKVHFNVTSDNVSMENKLESIAALANRLAEGQIKDVAPVVDALNAYIEKVENMPLNRERCESLICFSEKNEKFFIANSKKELFRAYMSTVDVKIKDGGVECIDVLPDVIALKNDIQHNKYEYENELKYSEILNKNIQLLSETDIVKNKNLRQDIKDKINMLVALEVKDLLIYPPVRITQEYVGEERTESESISDKLDQLKAYIADAVLMRAESVLNGENDGAIAKGIASDILDLKNSIAALGNTDGLKDDIAEVKSQCNALLEKLSAMPSVSDGSVRAYSGESVSLNEIVVQLDRLFDDIKVVIAQSDVSTVKKIEENTAALQEMRRENEDAAEKISIDVRALEKQIAESPLVSNSSGILEGLNVLMLRAEEGIDAQNELKEQICDVKENGIAVIVEEIAQIKTIVTSLKDQLDCLSRANTRVINEIDKLRDQMFSVSMISVESDGEEKVDSYNNVIFDEICALREDFDKLKQDMTDGNAAHSENVSAALRDILQETEVIKARLELAADDQDALLVYGANGSKEKLTKSLDELKKELEQLVKDI